MLPHSPFSDPIIKIIDTIIFTITDIIAEGKSAFDNKIISLYKASNLYTNFSVPQVIKTRSELNSP